MYYHIIREEPSMWISVFIFCLLFPNFDFQCKMIHLFVRFFQRKKILLYNKIIQQYLRALFGIFFSNSNLLYTLKNDIILSFFLDYYYTQELHVFLKILLFLFFSIDDCSRDRFRYVLPEYPKPRRKTPTFLVPEPDSNMSRWRWVCELNMNPTFGFVL